MEWSHQAWGRDARSLQELYITYKKAAATGPAVSPGRVYCKGKGPFVQAQCADRLSTENTHDKISCRRRNAGTDQGSFYL